MKAFIEAATSVCDVLERVDDLPEVEFLRELQRLLPLAYSLSHRMPDLFHHNDDEGDEDGEDDYESVMRPWPQAMSETEHLALREEFSRRIGKKLGPHNHVAWKYDPAEPDAREIVDGELSEILASLYVNLKEGLMLYARSSDEERSQGLWDLWFGMKHEWGSKVTQAFLPIHSLLHWHYDAIGEDWWANYHDGDEPLL